MCSSLIIWIWPCLGCWKVHLATETHGVSPSVIKIYTYRHPDYTTTTTTHLTTSTLHTPKCSHEFYKHATQTWTWDLVSQACWYFTTGTIDGAIFLETVSRSYLQQLLSYKSTHNVRCSTKRILPSSMCGLSTCWGAKTNSQQGAPAVF